MSQDRQVCPKCHEAGGVHRLQEAFAAQFEIIRQAAAASSPAESVDSLATPAGSGTNASGEQILVGALMQVLLEIGKVAVDAAVVRPATTWWQTKGQEAMRERRKRLVQTLQEALDRHPDLYLCARDDVVFLPGSSRSLPSRKAVEMLFKGEDGRLMSMLGT